MYGDSKTCCSQKWLYALNPGSGHACHLVKGIVFVANQSFFTAGSTYHLITIASCYGNLQWIFKTNSLAHSMLTLAALILKLTLTVSIPDGVIDLKKTSPYSYAYPQSDHSSPPLTM